MLVPKCVIYLFFFAPCSPEKPSILRWQAGCGLYMVQPQQLPYSDCTAFWSIVHTTTCTLRRSTLCAFRQEPPPDLHFCGCEVSKCLAKMQLTRSGSGRVSLVFMVCGHRSQKKKVEGRQASRPSLWSHPTAIRQYIRDPLKLYFGPRKHARGVARVNNKVMRLCFKSKFMRLCFKCLRVCFV